MCECVFKENQACGRNYKSELMEIMCVCVCVCVLCVVCVGVCVVCVCESVVSVVFKGESSMWEKLQK